MSVSDELKHRAIRRKFEARELINQFKSKSCTDCNHKFHTCQMDFIRKDGYSSKISRRLLRSKKAILAEIAICDLVCANCGRLRNWKRQRAKRMGYS
jgi:hypothetical protein